MTAMAPLMTAMAARMSVVEPTLLREVLGTASPEVRTLVAVGRLAGTLRPVNLRDLGTIGASRCPRRRPRDSFH